MYQVKQENFENNIFACKLGHIKTWKSKDKHIRDDLS